MSAPLKVALYTPQALSLPSQRIRIVEPLAFVERPLALRLCSGFTAAGQFAWDPDAWREADAVIVQRNFPNAQTIGTIRAIAAAGKPIVYETDDAFALIPDDHPKAFHKACAPFIAETARLARVVVTATRPLAECFADARDVRVLPNMLSPRIWGAEPPMRQRPAAHEGRVRVAMIGGMDHLADFLSIGSVLQRLAREHDRLNWLAYGDGAAAALAQLGLHAQEVVARNYDYATHPQRLAALQADVALCPLVDHAFNRCKSDIKFIEFGWLGVPCVVSDLPPYAETVTHGERGLRCRTEDDWHAAIGMLVHDAERRLRLGAAAARYARAERQLGAPARAAWQRVLQDALHDGLPAAGAPT